MIYTNVIITRENYSSVAEEIANSITNGIGTLFAAAALIFLIITATKSGEPVRIVSFAVYGSSLLIMFLMSTLYHSLMFTRARHVFRILDHTSIFLFIAGSFTPFILITIESSARWIMLSVIWTIAVGAIIYTVFNVHKTNLLLFFYLAMGWLGVFIFKPYAMHRPVLGLIFLIAGGLLYSLGTIFYKWKKLVFHHSVWHAFVLVAAACHFVSILHL